MQTPAPSRKKSETSALSGGAAAAAKKEGRSRTATSSLSAAHCHSGTPSKDTDAIKTKVVTSKLNVQNSPQDAGDVSVYPAHLGGSSSFHRVGQETEASQGKRDCLACRYDCR